MASSWKEMAEQTTEVLLEDGPYIGRVKSAKVGQTSTGKDQISILFEIVDGPHAGKTVYENLVFSVDNPKAMRVIFARLAALGYTQEYLMTQEPPLEVVAEGLTGRTVALEIGHRVWNGESRNNVTKIAPHNGGAVPTPAPAAPAAAPIPAPVPAPQGATVPF